jgi:hypothetical protein
LETTLGNTISSTHKRSQGLSYSFGRADPYQSLIHHLILDVANPFKVSHEIRYLPKKKQVKRKKRHDGYTITSISYYIYQLITNFFIDTALPSVSSVVLERYIKFTGQAGSGPVSISLYALCEISLSIGYFLALPPLIKRNLQTMSCPRAEHLQKW